MFLCCFCWTHACLTHTELSSITSPTADRSPTYFDRQSERLAGKFAVVVTSSNAPLHTPALAWCWTRTFHYLPSFIDTVCGRVYATICPSVCSICRPLQQHAAAGLLLWARQTRDIDQQRRALGARQHGAACSRCEQCHVVSRRRILNTNLLVLTLLLLALLVAQGVTTWGRHVHFPTTSSTVGSLSCMCYRVFIIRL